MADTGAIVRLAARAEDAADGLPRERRRTPWPTSSERTIWLSHLDPLGRVGLNLSRQGSPVRVLQRLYQDEIDTRPLRVKYGPRPDGLPN